MRLPGRKRKGIGWAVVVFVFGFFIFGVVWTVLYFGTLLPLSTSQPSAYPNAFDSTSLAFVQTFIAWWPFVVLGAYIFWLWQKSNKTGLGF